MSWPSATQIIWILAIVLDNRMNEIWHVSTLQAQVSFLETL